MVAVVFGIPGVGKSSIVQQLCQDLGMERLHWGGIALEIGQQKGIIEQIDQLRKREMEVQKEVQAETVKIIVDKLTANPDKHYLIETHAAVKTPQGYLPGFTPEWLEQIKPNLFIVYEAAAGHVYHRRMIDTTRERSDDLTLNEIQIHFDITRYYSSSFAVLAKANMVIIENREGDLTYAVNKTSDILSRFI